MIKLSWRNKKEVTEKPCYFLLKIVELEGIEPSSKRRVNLLSTRLAFYQIFVRSLRRKQS